MTTESLDARRFDREPSWRTYFNWMRSSIVGRTCTNKLVIAHRSLEITEQNLPEILASLADLLLLLARSCWITPVHDTREAGFELGEELKDSIEALACALQEEDQLYDAIGDAYKKLFNITLHPELNKSIILISDVQPLAKDGPYFRPLAEILSNFLNVHYASLPQDQTIDYRERFKVLERILGAMLNITERVLQQPAISLAPIHIETDSHLIAETIQEHCKLLMDYGDGRAINSAQMESFIQKLYELLASLPKHNMKLLVSAAYHPIMLLSFGLLKSLDRLDEDLLAEVLLSKVGKPYLDDLLHHLVNQSIPESGLAWALEDLALVSIGWEESEKLGEIWDAIVSVFSSMDCEPSPFRFSSELSSFGYVGYVGSRWLDVDSPEQWPFDLKLVMLLGRDDLGIVIPDQDYDDLETWNQWVCSTISDALSRGYLELAEALFILLLIQNARYPKTELDPWQDIWKAACALKEKGGVDFRAFAERISAEYASLYETSHGLLSCRFDRIGRLLSGSQTKVDLLKLRELFDTRIMSEDEIVDLYRERLGAELFKALNDISKNELIKFEQLYRQHLYQEKRDDTFDWAHVVLMPFKVFEREMAGRIKRDLGNKEPPTLGTMVTELKNHKDGKSTELGELLERRFPNLDLADLKKLRKWNFKYRNRSAHGIEDIIDRERTRELYREFFEGGFMRQVLERIVMPEKD